MNNKRIKQFAAMVIASLILAGCATKAPQTTVTPEATANISAEYERAVAQKIYASNASRVFSGQPQAMLRAVIVLRYYIDSNGRLISSEMIRNHTDKAAIATATNSLKAASPFPAPSPALLKNGRVEISESWLFNDDGRFQLLSIAEKQKGE